MKKTFDKFAGGNGVAQMRVKEAMGTKGQLANERGLAMGKCVLGIILIVLGIVLIAGGFGGAVSGVGAFYLGMLPIAAGGTLLFWGLYKWQRKKAVETISEAIKKSKEKEE